MENRTSGNSGTESKSGKIIIATVEDFPRARKERPPCPECGSLYISSRGIEWECRECGRRYLKKKRGVYYTDKPDCIYCGSKHIQSQSPNWFCCDCMRSFRKSIQLSVKPELQVVNKSSTERE